MTRIIIEARKTSTGYVFEFTKQGDGYNMNNTLSATAEEGREIYDFFDKALQEKTALVFRNSLEGKQ